MNTKDEIKKLAKDLGVEGGAGWEQVILLDIATSLRKLVEKK